MANRKNHQVIYPTTLNVDHFHNIVISQRGTVGYNTKGLIDVGIEWARDKIEYYIPSPGLLHRAAAMIFAYVNFHAFNDGNKRTALLGASFFFFLNGFSFDIPLDAPDFTVEVAERWENLDSPEPIVEIERIVAWLRSRVKVPPILLRGLQKFIITHTRLDEKGWEDSMKPWLQEATRQMEIVGRKHDKHHRQKSDDS